MQLDQTRENGQVKIGVVIPFYQRSAGILSRALTSIRNQNLPPDVELEVIVVDDQSPVAAAAEVSSFSNSEKIGWNVIRQSNAGPGVARNSGIEWLADKGVRYVAFLDSDDEWRSDHLSNAVTALEKGGDLYFSDHSRSGHYRSYFEEDANVYATLNGIKSSSADLVDGGTRFFSSSQMISAFVKSYLAQTSTVVLRCKALGQSRFDPELRHCGEDYMLWIELISKEVRVCISNEVEVFCGPGINLYHSSLDWDSENILNLLSSQIIFYGKMVRLPLGSALQDAKTKLQEFRRLYAYLLLKRLVLRRLPAQTGLRHILRRDPLLGLEAPLLIGQFMLIDRRRIAR